MIIQGHKRGSMLIELVVALSIGLLAILQLTTFLVGFVQQMHVLASNERRFLQEGVVIDVLMQDLKTAVNVVDSGRGPEMTNGVELKLWRMREGELPRLITVSWKKNHGHVQRRVDNSVTPQMFGPFLDRLRFDMEKRYVHFVDVAGKEREIGF